MNDVEYEYVFYIRTQEELNEFNAEYKHFSHKVPDFKRMSKSYRCTIRGAWIWKRKNGYMSWQTDDSRNKGITHMLMAHNNIIDNAHEYRMDIRKVFLKRKQQDIIRRIEEG